MCAITERPSKNWYVDRVPWSLKRYQQSRELHFLTFSCYRRQPLLTADVRTLFEQTLEAVRRKYAFYVCGYVVMPEHVHLLTSEPERQTLGTAIQVLKQRVGREIDHPDRSFWQKRYYDFNVFSESKRLEKLNYMHQNPVERGLVKSAEEWKWSSFRHYMTGERGTVEIESQWTARRRERDGVVPVLKWQGFEIG